MFRYSSHGVRSYNLSTPLPSYFSIDNGVSNLAVFNNNPQYGDTGDWAVGSPYQIQNAAGTPGHTIAGSSIESIALDIIGYNFVSNSIAFSNTNSPSIQPNTNAISGNQNSGIIPIISFTTTIIIVCVVVVAIIALMCCCYLRRKRSPNVVSLGE